jgi:hypothetical protein
VLESGVGLVLVPVLVLVLVLPRTVRERGA